MQRGVSGINRGFVFLRCFVLNIFSAETERSVLVLMVAAIHGWFGQVGGARSGERVRLVFITEHTSRDSGGGRLQVF